MYQFEPPAPDLDPAVIRKTEYAEQHAFGRRLISRTVWFIDKRGDDDAYLDTWEEPQ